MPGASTSGLSMSGGSISGNPATRSPGCPPRACPPRACRPRACPPRPPRPRACRPRACPPRPPRPRASPPRASPRQPPRPRRLHLGRLHVNRLDLGRLHLGRLHVNRRSGGGSGRRRGGDRGRPGGPAAARLRLGHGLVADLDRSVHRSQEDGDVRGLVLDPRGPAARARLEALDRDSLVGERLLDDEVRGAVAVVRLGVGDRRAEDALDVAGDDPRRELQVAVGLGRAAPADADEHDAGLPRRVAHPLGLGPDQTGLFERVGHDYLRFDCLSTTWPR